MEEQQVFLLWTDVKQQLFQLWAGLHFFTAWDTGTVVPIGKIPPPPRGGGRREKSVNELAAVDEAGHSLVGTWRNQSWLWHSASHFYFLTPCNTAPQ
jgi:hypothetical protein